MYLSPLRRDQSCPVRRSRTCSLPPELMPNTLPRHAFELLESSENYGFGWPEGVVRCPFLVSVKVHWCRFVIHSGWTVDHSGVSAGFVGRFARELTSIIQSAARGSKRGRCSSLTDPPGQRYLARPTDHSYRCLSVRRSCQESIVIPSGAGRIWSLPRSRILRALQWIRRVQTITTGICYLFHPMIAVVSLSVEV